MLNRTVSGIMLSLLLIGVFPSTLNVHPVKADPKTWTLDGGETIEYLEPPETEWNKTYGGASLDGASSVVQTSDGGYALAGHTCSFGAGTDDAWLVKVDSSGNHQWNKTYGGGKKDVASSVVQTSDYGYALAGYTLSFGAGETDAWLVKVAGPRARYISIYTDKYSYFKGDTMHVGLNVTNPLGRPITVCIAIWLERPVSPIIVILHAHAVTLPAGFTYSNPDFETFVLPAIPSGTYTWHAAFLKPANHQILVEDTAEWQFGVAAGEYWAVLVGIEDYMYIDDCAWANNDAIDTYNALLSYPATPWTADHIILLVDYDGTEANIQSAINWMATNADPEDTCIFQFSGHGSYSIDVYPYDEVDGYDEYICPADTTGSAATMTSDDELTAWLDEIDAKKVVWLDSCFSGGFIKADGLAPRTWKGVSHVQLTDGFSRDLDKTGYVVSTACDEDELAWGHPAIENGIFTYFLVEGLLGPADANIDGKITAEEAFAYANPLVLATGYETPQMWDGIEGEVTVVAE